MPPVVRKIWISLFVVLWLTVFHYESLRVFFLQPLAGRALPKVKFLYPPAGWIMFYRVGDHYAHAEVYGRQEGRWRRIDPHEIIATRFIGFDNIHRGVLGHVLARQAREPFCRYLEHRLPSFDGFTVTAVEYPSLSQTPQTARAMEVYQCP